MQALFRWGLAAEFADFVVLRRPNALTLPIPADLYPQPARADADGVILGCTEITMPIDQADPDVPALDTNRPHAEAVTSFATATGP